MTPIAEEILKRDNFLITAHIEPDGDAVGSSLAMLHALTLLGKCVCVCLSDFVPPLYRFLPGAERIERDLPPDFSPECVIVLDCSSLERTGRIQKQIRMFSPLIINIDHHQGNSCYGDLSLVRNASATGELIYDLIKTLNVKPSKEIGICLYTAILTDTGGFRYRNTTRRSLRIASEIVGLGVNPGEITEKVCESYPLERFRVLGRALKGLKISCKGKVADLVVTREMFNGGDTNPSIVDGFVNYPREIEGVLVSVFFREKAENQYRVSLRSKGDADVASVAETFGGGGHKNAAGYTVDGEFEFVREIVLKKICEQLRRAAS
jgi:phosphoesterase RecJ-like protein